MAYWTAFALGLVGSLHCAGMCGPLALAVQGGAASGSRLTLGCATYNVGRIVTYCGLGLVFGLFGKTLWLAGIQRWVSIWLGIMLIVGLFASYKLAFWKPVTTAVNLLKSAMSTLLRQRSLLSVGLLGLLNGLLPCGLVYVAGAGATATGNILSGALYMAAFGLGTFPMMLVIGFGGRLLPSMLRRNLSRAVPVSVFLLGTLLIVRGMSLGIPYLSPDLASGTSCCHR